MGYKWITTWQKSVLDGWMVLVYPVTQTRLGFQRTKAPMDPAPYVDALGNPLPPIRKL